MKFHFNTQQGHKYWTNQEAVSYADAHRYRLGTHYEALPVNAPRSPVNHYHKDGAMRFFINGANPDAYYEPNSIGGPEQAPAEREPPLALSGDADRYDHRAGNDDFGQPRALWSLFDAAQKQRLYSNIAAAMAGVPENIVRRQLALFERIHQNYAAGVAKLSGCPYWWRRSHGRPERRLTVGRARRRISSRGGATSSRGGGTSSRGNGP